VYAAPKHMPLSQYCTKNAVLTMLQESLVLYKLILSCSFFQSYTATIFKPTQQNSSGRFRVGRFGLEIWNIGDDMIISVEIAVSSISFKVLQLHLVQERFAYVLRVAFFHIMLAFGAFKSLQSNCVAKQLLKI
jgi:hypothetical protein